MADRSKTPDRTFRLWKDGFEDAEIADQLQVTRQYVHTVLGPKEERGLNTDGQLRRLRRELALPMVGESQRVTGFRCGTRSAYIKGCRCTGCRAAGAEYRRRRREGGRRG
jgi:hypothetical protein